MNPVIIKVIAQLGGKKLFATIATTVLMPILVQYVPAEIASEFIYAVAGIVSAFVLGQGVADGMSGGATSSMAVLENEK